MKGNFIKNLLVIILLKSSVILAQTAVAPLAGDGSSGSPYEIATWQNLYWISQNSAHWDKHYIQTANIDFADADPAIDTWDGGKGWPPIADYSIPFTGNYNGLDHTITNIFINRPTEQNVALFGSTSSSASISNVGLVGGSVIGTSYVGNLVGYNNGAISNAYATGSVTCNSHSVGGLVGFNRGAISDAYATGSVLSGDMLGGGLVGDNKGTISNAHATGSVTGKYYVGGLVGWQTDGTISDSYATGDVTGKRYIGGLAGEQQTASITDAYAMGVVTGETYVGGLVGRNIDGEIRDVQALGNVSGNYDVGGLVGNHASGSITKASATGSVIGNIDYAGGLVGCLTEGSISDTWATGDVTGGKYAGGLVGANEAGNINNSYATGSVSGKDYVGGFIGKNDGTINNSYSRGNVTRSSGVLYSFGGFVGQHWDGSITNSYSTGWVKYTGSNPEIQTNKGFAGGAGATITNSFWDKETSGASTSAGTATGKTTAEMKTQATFTDAGWDFIGESTNGVNDYWEIFSYDGYPFFTWQYYLPTVTTQSVTDIAVTTATGNGNITDLGCPYPSQHGVCWNTSGTPTIADNKTEEGSSSATGAFTSSITGLSPNTQYYVRAYTTNGEVITYGNQTDFTTLEMPIVTTNDVVSVTFNSAISGGNVISGNGVTERGVCWSTNPNPTIADSRTFDGSGLGSFESNITGLDKNAKYYVRAYATNSAGTAYGVEKSFITPNQIYNMLDFDGTNDYVTVPITLPEQGTIEFWFYADVNTTGYLWSGAATYWYSNVWNGQIYTWIGGSPGGAIIVSGISANKWYHLAVTWVKAGVSVTSQVYLNGNLKGTTNNQWASPGTSISLGKKASSFFNGKIEEFKIWNTVRTPTDLRSDMHKFISPSSSNLLCYYNFDSSSGSTATDGTSNGYNGTLINMTNAAWTTSTAPTGVYGTYVRTTTQTTVGETGKTISATISSGGDDTNFLGIYSYGEGDAIISCETYPPGVTRRSNIIWGVAEFGSVTADITFDYSNISELGVESVFKLLKRATAISDWTDVTGSVTQNTGNHTFTMTGVTSFPEFTVAEHEIFTDDFAGNALDFDGSNANINVGNGISFDLGNVLTIEAWVKPDVQTSRQGIFSTRSSNSSGSFQLEIGSANGGSHCVAVSGVNTWVAQTGDNVYNDGEWVHLAYVRTGTGSGTHTIYINGVIQTLISDDPYGFTDNTDNKVIGAGTSDSQFFDGIMDEVRIWNEARTEKQIQENMHGALTGYETGLVSYYQFNEGSGTTTCDNVSLNTGTLVNMGSNAFVASTAPIPFVSVADGVWANTAIWLSGQGYPANPWARAKINSNISLETNMELIDIAINEDKSLTLSPGTELTVTGDLVNEAGTSGLILQSDASGTASLIHSNANVEATAQRFISAWSDADRGRHLVSSPVSAQAISPEFADVTATPMANDLELHKWSELLDQWVNIKDQNGNYNQGTDAENWSGDSNPLFEQARGYRIAYETNQTKSFTGNLNAEDISLSGLTNTDGNFHEGWHLLGNPFSAAISYNQGSWNKNNIAAYTQVWDDPSASYQVLRGDQIIPVHTGFMVYTSGNGTLTIPADARQHYDATSSKSSHQENEIILKVTDSENQTGQETIIAFQAEASSDFDMEYDSYFIAGLAPQFYSISNNKPFALNTMPALNNELIIPLGFEKNNSSTFTISVSKNIEGQTLWLADLKNNTEHNLSQSSYTFASEPGDDPNRFHLSFNCINPTNGGEIGSDQTICYNTAPATFTNEALPSGHLGELEYQWQISTSSPTFVEIEDSNSETYTHTGTLTQTTWFRRLARVECDPVDWASATASNVVEVTVRPHLTAGAIETTGETICFNTLPTVIIGSTTDASGGDGNITYSWRSSVDNFAVAISGATDATYTPTVSLTTTTSYRRYAQDATCNATAEVSAGTWTVTVLDDFTTGEIASTGEIICYGTTPSLMIGSITAAVGGDGSITYSWYSSADNYTDAIFGAAGATYTPSVALTSTTAYRRYAKDATCNATMEVSAGTWTVTVQDEFNPGEIAITGEIICYNTNPQQVIGSAVDASGGDGTITYSWKSSADGFTNDIPGAVSQTYTPEGPLNATTSYRRYAKDGTCNTEPELSVGMWTITLEQIPAGGSLSKSPDKNRICQGSVVFATLTAGSGGNGTDVIEYRTHDGSEWSVWVDYTSGTEINTTGITEVQIHTWREATLCEDSGVVTVTWETELCCANPIIAGSISENQTICSGTAPGTIENTASPSGHTGDLEYMWQWSTTSAVAGFNDIANSDVASYSPGNLTNTTWFRRLARVTCVTDDWATAVITDAVKIYILGEEQIEEPWYSCNTHSSANGTSVYYPCEPGAPYKLTATGHSTPPNDVMHFVYQYISGTNATVIARLADVQNGGWAGVMMREGDANGNCVNNARTILFKTRLYNPSVRIETRTTQGHVMHHTTQVAHLIRWIKIQRNGNNFRVFTSDNGTVWQQRYSINITMNSTIQAGIFTESVQPNRIATAWFDHVEVVNFLKSGDDFAGIVTNEPGEGQLRVDIYPNPADDMVTISIPENEGKANFSITELDGRVIKQSSFTGSETMLDVSSFRPGMYFIRLELNGEIFTRRLVVM